VSTQPASTEVTLAAVLMGLAAGLGVLLMAVGARLFLVHDDLLMLVLPVVATVLFLTGLYLTGAALVTATGLWQAKPGARLRTTVIGGCVAVAGVFVMVPAPVTGLLLTLYGGGLVYLMSTPAAARDLGPSAQYLEQQAPWGSRPGTRLWSSAPAQQGPWAPDPRTLPWFSWKNHSGPRAPWWQTWQAGLAQGIPLWELVVLVLALLVLAVGLVAVPFALAGSHHLGTLRLTGGTAGWLFLLVPAAVGVVAWLEQRMRRRLATRA
jgi:hypothetical protein